MKRKQDITLAISMVSTIILSIMAIFPVYATTEIYLAPSDNIFETATTSVGYKWNITLWVKDVAELFAYQVRMYYNHTMTNITGAWHPLWDSQYVFYGRTSTPVVSQRADYVQIGDSIVVGDTFNGTGKLAIIEFQIISAPYKMDELSCIFNISNPDTYLLDFNLNEMPTLKTDGLYKYTWSSPPKPHLAINPTLVVQPHLGAIFDIEVYIMELDADWYLTNATMSICYNTTVIDVIGGAANITVNPNWIGPNEVYVTHDVPNPLMITVRDPLNANGNLLIATVKFTVLSHGKTNITFSDYHIYDHVIEIPTNPPQNGTVNTEIAPQDIAITDVKPSKTTVGQGFNVMIDVIVENQGNYTETFAVIAYVNTTGIQTEWITLKNGSFATITFIWNTSSFAKGNYTLSAHAIPLPYEIDITDNTYTNGTVIVAIIGDLTGPEGIPDGKVDIRDIAAVAVAFGSYPGNPRWNPNADVNSDNTVNIKDIAMVAKNYGKTDP